MPSPATKLVATAIARTGVYYKRSGIYAAVVGLAACVGVLLVEDTLPKGVLFVSAVFFAVVAWRTLRTANRYFDPDGSPVLRAILRDHEHIASVRAKRDGDGALLVVEDDRGHHLDLRVGKRSADEELAALLDAFAELAPSAEVQRDGP